MSLFNIFNTAGSAMNAQSIRLNVIASNIANANVIAGTPEDAYKSRQVVFSETLNTQTPGQFSAGVEVSHIARSQQDHGVIYQPGHPLANKEGYVFQSNVNSIEEMANMISASRSYQSNVEVLNTSKSMMLRTLRLGE